MSYETRKKKRTVTDVHVKLDGEWFDLPRLVSLLGKLDNTGWAGDRVRIGSGKLRDYLEKEKIIATDRNRNQSWVENDKKREALYDEMVELLCGEDND